MKNYAFLILLALTLAFVGCRKLLTFHIQYQSSFVIPSTTGIDLPINLPTPDQATQSEQTFEANDTRKDLVESIVLNTLVLTITNPTGKTFSFLKSVDISIQGENLSATKIASATNIPANVGAVLNLSTTQTNIAEHIKATKFKLLVTVITDETLLQNVSVDADMDLVVEAKGLL